MLTANGATSSAPGPMAFEAIGTFQFTPPAKFDGKKDNFEEFALKLKSYARLMDPGDAQAFKVIEDSPDTVITDAAFIDEDNDLTLALIKVAGQFSGLW